VKLYYMVAIWKDENGDMKATRMAEGEAHDLRVELELLPLGTFRVGVMDKKVFDEILRTSEALPLAEVQERSCTESGSDP
jgi:hypothetical protein